METNRFSIIPDLNKLAQQAVISNFDSDAFKEEAYNFDHCPNIASWVYNRKYCPFEPFPVQLEIMSGFMEAYCPICSDLAVATGMWGRSIEEIYRKVVFYEYGVCPNCKIHKSQLRNEGRVNDYNEFVGVMGQRCLDPDTPVWRDEFTQVPLISVNVGDYILGPTRLPVKITKIYRQYQPGSFFLGFSHGEKVVCSDAHQWKIERNGKRFVTHTSELQKGDIFPTMDGNAVELTSILKVHGKCKMMDITVEGEYFCIGSTLDKAIITHNSGKSEITAVMANYILHKMLMLPVPPWKYYGLAPNAVLTMMFVATSKGQASDTVWSKFLGQLEASAWFKEYFAYLKAKQKQEKTRYYNANDSSVTFYKKKLKCTFAMPDPSTLRGLTRFFAAIDELGWLSTDPKNVRNANDVYQALSSSVETIRQSVMQLWDKNIDEPLTGYMINISSPSSEQDQIMQLLYASELAKRMYGVHLATWEVNPQYTKESLNDVFIRDPVAAWRNFGAVPPSSKNAYFDQPDRIYALCNPEKHNDLIDVHIDEFSQQVRDRTFYYIKPTLYTASSRRVLDEAYVLTVDAGEVDNDFSICVSHYEEETNKRILDLVINLTPGQVNTPEGVFPVAVHFPSICNFITGWVDTSGESPIRYPGLKDYLPLYAVILDQWQNIMLKNTLRDEGIMCDVHSPRLSEMDAFKDSVYASIWEIPQVEDDPKRHKLQPKNNMPVLKMCIQTATIRLLGKKLIKPEVGSDDAFRCWAAADVFFSDEKNLKGYLAFRNKIKASSGTMNTRRLSSDLTVFSARSGSAPRLGRVGTSVIGYSRSGGGVYRPN